MKENKLSYESSLPEIRSLSRQVNTRLPANLFLHKQRYLTKLKQFLNKNASQDSLQNDYQSAAADPCLKGQKLRPTARFNHYSLKLLQKRYASESAAA
jgi:hypothetical protein